MSMDAMMQKWGGGEVLKKAVRGMLPKNRLRDKRLARLKVFEGAAHPYKENIVRFEGRIHRGEGKGVMDYLKTAKAPPVEVVKEEVARA